MCTGREAASRLRKRQSRQLLPVVQQLRRVCAPIRHVRCAPSIKEMLPSNPSLLSSLYDTGIPEFLLPPPSISSSSTFFYPSRLPKNHRPFPSLTSRRRHETITLSPAEVSFCLPAARQLTAFPEHAWFGFMMLFGAGPITNWFRVIYFVDSQMRFRF